MTSEYSADDATHYCHDCEQPLVVEAVLDGFDVLLSTGDVACGDCYGTNVSDISEVPDDE